MMDRVLGTHLCKRQQARVLREHRHTEHLAYTAPRTNVPPVFFFLAASPNCSFGCWILQQPSHDKTTAAAAAAEQEALMSLS